MDAFIQFLTEWGYWGMFLSAFLAGTILPFSSEAVMLACVGLGLDPVLSTLATTAGNALGGLTCYWIGHLGKMEWIEKYFRVDQTAGESHTLYSRTRFLDGLFLFSAHHRRCCPDCPRPDACQCVDRHFLNDPRKTGPLCHSCCHDH